MKLAWRIGRYLLVVTLLVGVGGSLNYSVMAGEFVPWNFFGYFTIQSNIIGAIALGVAAHFTGRERPAWVEYLRASAAVYLTVVVTVFWVMLYTPGYVNWTDFICHLVSGVVLLVDWLVEGPRTKLPLHRVEVIMIYPAIWTTVILIRGATDGWFPYPFLDPAGGYGPIAIVVAGIMVAGLAIGAVLFRVTGWRVITPTKTPPSTSLREAP